MWLPMHRRPSLLTNLRKKPKVETSAFSHLMSSPKTEKIDGENTIFEDLKMEIGHSGMQGYRVTMEDKHIIDRMTLTDHVLVAIMDGHAGNLSAIHTANLLKAKIEETDSWKEYAKLDPADRKLRASIELLNKALVGAYEKMDEVLDTMEGMDESGCTAVCSIITPSHIVCANVGDSRCVVGTDEKTISMTEDHKPSNLEERQRIESAGGFVMWDRVNGELAMSRALGDFRYKKDTHLKSSQFLVICYPDISVYERNAVEKQGTDQIMVLACDGVWDVITNDDSVNFLCDAVFGEDLGKGPKQVKDKGDVKKGKGSNSNGKEDEDEDEEGGVSSSGMGSGSVSCEGACEALIDLAFNEGSTDNISAVVVRFY